MASWWNPPLCCVINDRGSLAVNVCGDFMVLSVTEGVFARTRTKTIYRTSPRLPEICAALKIANPFA